MESTSALPEWLSAQHAAAGGYLHALRRYPRAPLRGGSDFDIDLPTCDRATGRAGWPLIPPHGGQTLREHTSTRPLPYLAHAPARAGREATAHGRRVGPNGSTGGWSADSTRDRSDTRGSSRGARGSLPQSRRSRDRRLPGTPTPSRPTLPHPVAANAEALPFIQLIHYRRVTQYLLTGNN
jgi:hypothetical protein